MGISGILVKVKILVSLRVCWVHSLRVTFAHHLKKKFCVWLCTAHGITVSRSGIEPTSPAVEVQNFNHWTAREVPVIVL